MYLHLGSDVVVSQSEVIAILDLDTTSVSKITRQFLDSTQKGGRVVEVSKGDLPKSYVLCGGKDSYCIYVSPLSAQTLYKRAAGAFKIE
ncbi:MAG TPA: DUF370 domain-containing protein [Candidatus Aphodoplasma excrementigallinarum]|uniref:DUF370 domain-containing protein n=1 Tax=Candidatus Aphodoplasma excrementigallinarum TaxID=2840673 RepID=A0A9D1T007_9FIRM|nr:DUF370 domain-containing protein [Candidatus Aphodoplasma excrementigallinarum]